MIAAALLGAASLLVPGCMRSGYVDGAALADVAGEHGTPDATDSVLWLDGAMPDRGLSVGLVARYSMDTAATNGVIQDVTGGHDALCSAGQCPTSTAGKVGGALLFDGVDDRAEVDTSGGDFEATSGFTVAVWVRPNGPTSGLRCVATKVHSGVTDDENSWALFQCDEGWGYETYDGAAGGFIYGADGALPPGAWQHVALAWNGKVKLLYVNGELASAATRSVAFSGAELLIGADFDFNANLFFFAGAMDELRIYNRCLDPAEIKALAEP